MILTITPKALDADVSPRDAALRFESMLSMQLISSSYTTAHEAVETAARALFVEGHLPSLLIRVGFDGELHRPCSCGLFHDPVAMDEFMNYFGWYYYADKLIEPSQLCEHNPNKDDPDWRDSYD